MKTIEHKNGVTMKTALVSYIEDLRIGIGELEKLFENFDGLEIDEFVYEVAKIDDVYLNPGKYIDMIPLNCEED